MPQNPRVRIFSTATKPVVVVDRLHEEVEYLPNVTDSAVVLCFPGDVDVDPSDLAALLAPAAPVSNAVTDTLPGLAVYDQLRARLNPQPNRVPAGSLRRSDLPWIRQPGEGTAVGEPERVIDWGSQPPQGGVK